MCLLLWNSIFLLLLFDEWWVSQVNLQAKHLAKWRLSRIFWQRHPCGHEESICDKTFTSLTRSHCSESRPMLSSGEAWCNSDVGLIYRTDGIELSQRAGPWRIITSLHGSINQASFIYQMADKKIRFTLKCTFNLCSVNVNLSFLFYIMISM